MNQQKLVIVGTTKPILNYVTACITLFNSGEQQIVVRARGKAINVAVEVVQILRSRFMRDVTISSAQISGDQVKGRDGRNFNLPVLEIMLSK